MGPPCPSMHDWFSDILTGGLIIGLWVSYLPQHYRIISKGTSEGFSPWFLLLGSTSSASGMLNMVVMQHILIGCCFLSGPLDCLELVAGIIQVGTQWFLFTVILVLYIIYFPPHLKYVTLDIDADESRPSERVRTDIKSDTWRLSVILSWIVAIHLAFCTFVTLMLILSEFSDSPDPGAIQSQMNTWAIFLGVSSALLAAFQYAPQIVHTYRLKLVGALSIPMMLIQTPGGFIMVYSITIRLGTNWTSWIMFLVAALMQGVLLVMCLCWKVRQRRLGIDDFGHPLTDSPPEDESVEDSMEEDIVSITAEEAERMPLVTNRRRKKRSKKWSSWLKWMRIK